MNPEAHSEVHRFEAVIKPGFRDPLGKKTKRKINDLGIPVEDVRTIRTYYVEGKPDNEELDFLAKELFSDSIIENVSVDRPIGVDGADWYVEKGPVPGSKDPEGDTARDVLKSTGYDVSNVHATTTYAIKGRLNRKKAEEIAEELIYSTEIDRYKVSRRVPFSKVLPFLPRRMERHYMGVPVIPQELLDHEPTVGYINLAGLSDDELLGISKKRSFALNVKEMNKIRDKYSEPRVIEERKKVGLEAQPTDVEMEAIAQTWSEHCKHKIFNALVHYTDENGETSEIDSVFNTFLRKSTLQLQKKNPWIKSVLWDNAGAIQFNDDYLLAAKIETHNSPSAVDPFGGAITGIVGVHRDGKGFGRGGKVFCGYQAFLTALLDYDGNLVPRIHPSKLHEGIREGTMDGDNKHGIPTIDGANYFDNCYLGKPGVVVGTMSLIPTEVNGKPGESKELDVGDLIVMCGGRVGIDGIHGATESSLEGGKHISLGHVQMGDPYTQRKMFDFLEEARDKGLFGFIQDNGAGGLSSSVGEMGHFRENGGFVMDLAKVPLKYRGLDPWQILVSESQERMSVAVKPEKIKEFMELAEKHEVEVSVLGEFNDSGKYHVVYGDKTVTYLDMDFIHEGVPQMELNAKYLTPEERGLYEPDLHVFNYRKMLYNLLSSPNIASLEFMNRQWDHEVKGISVIKAFVGEESDVTSDASVVNPVLETDEGLAIGAAVNPRYMKINSYDGVACVLNEAIMRTVAVGGDPDMMFNVDNFLWPSPLPSPENPDAEFKLAQLVMANQALHDYTLAFNCASISGKDSMSMDGKVPDADGKEHRISAKPTLHFMVGAKVPDINNCVTMDVKKPFDLVYLVGPSTKNELGGSELYNTMGEMGLNVPKVDAEEVMPTYRSLHKAMQKGVINSCHGCYRGGLGVALAQSSFAGGYGMDIELSDVHREADLGDWKTLYSETQGRFVVTVSPEKEEAFESVIEGDYSMIGQVRDDYQFNANGIDDLCIISDSIRDLKETWKGRHANR